MRRTDAAANQGEQPIQFRRRDGQRIADAVRAHERGRKPAKASSLPRAAGGSGGSVVRGQFSGSWYKGQTKVVTISASGQTTRCNNFIVDILYSNSNRACFMAPFGENDIDYTLLIPECIR